MADNGLLLLCGTCLVPFLAGIGLTLVVQHRIKTIGMPWALLPGALVIKGLWTRYWSENE